MSDMICPVGEVFPFGGPGRFVLSSAQALDESLAACYEGKVTLIYLDPPFGTGDSFCIKPPGGKAKLSIPIYSDNLSTPEYLAMMEKVLRLCFRLLSPEGSLYLHIDYRMSARLRLMLDEIFGESNFLNEIIWSYKSGGRSLKHYSRKHDTILFYRKTPQVYFNISAIGVPRGPQKRNNMKRTVDDQGRICFSIRSGGKTYTYYEDTPIYPSDVWDDIEHMHQRDPERTGFATQKPEALLRRVILASSRPGDLVADLFSGSGTTAAVASANGRRFLAVDASPASMGVLRRRQLAAHRAASLFSESAGMSIEYPSAPLGDFNATLNTRRENGRVFLQLDGFESKLGLAYLALGKINEAGFFAPACYTLLPTPGSRLTDESGASNLAQLIDHGGRMRFLPV